MDSLSMARWPPFLQAMTNSSSFNSTASFPVDIMNTFLTSGPSSPLLQLFIFVYRRIGEQLGLDPSALLTIFGCLWGLYKLCTQLWDMIHNILNKHLRCSVTIPKGDPIYNHMMQYLAGKLTAHSRHLTVETIWKSVWDEDEKGANDDLAKSPAVTVADNGNGSHKLHNFSNLAARSGPLRRGYLFHGPPGTGKSSFSFALAGVFGLAIYVISLQESTLSEENLVFLLTQLPWRCIVLLEDIDTAGLRRADDAEPENESKGGISLSALLNAIDGVAAHEGRVLIMTSNRPEDLDEALVRPGRIDMQVAFKHASREQATELFYRMYNGLQLELENVDIAEGETKRTVAVITAEELGSLSEKFGQLVPEEMFSPAEIQGFLLKRKNSPCKALDDAADWITASVKQKESKSRVATVQ